MNSIRKGFLSILLSVSMVTGLCIPSFAEELPVENETVIEENIIDETESSEEDISSDEISDTSNEDINDTENISNTEDIVSEETVSPDTIVSDEDNENDSESHILSVDDNIEITSDTNAKENIASDNNAVSNNTISGNVWNILSYSGRQPVPFKSKDGKFYVVKGTKFYTGTGSTVSNPKVLKINKKGFVKVGKSGSSTLSSPIYGDIEVTVINPKLFEKTADIAVGDKKDIKILNIPEDLPLSWTSSNQNVIQVLNGICYGVGIGKSKVSAYICGKAYTCTISVEDKPGSTLLFNADNKKGTKIKGLKGVGSLTWSSSSNQISIQKGKIKANEPLKEPVTLDVSDGHKFYIYANNTDVEKEVNLKIGEKKFILSDITHELPVLKSKNNQVATISEYGVLIGNAPGKTVISGKYGSQKIKIKVNVSDEIYKGGNESVNDKVKQITVIDPINGNDGYSIDIDPEGNYEVIKEDERITPSENKPGDDPDNPDPDKPDPENPDSDEYLYIVNYYTMNLDGENYTLNKTNTFYAKKGKTVYPKTAVIEGFTAPEKKEVVINKNGIVVDYYYTRNKYDVSVTLDDNIETVSGQGSYFYGETVVLNAVPKADTDSSDWTVDGGYRYKDIIKYKFKRWSDGGSDPEHSFVMPAENVRIKATGSNEETKLEEYYLTINKGENMKSVDESGWKTKGSFVTTGGVTNDEYIEDDYTIDPRNSGRRYKKKHTFYINSPSVTMDGPKEVTVYAEDIVNERNVQYKVTITKDENIESVTPAVGEYWYDKDTSVAVSAVPKDGFDIKSGTGDHTVNEAKTIEVKSKLKDYTITYNLNGGSLSEGQINPASFNTSTETFTLNNPVREGYTFKGWSGTGLTGDSNLTVTINNGSTGDRTYTANWNVNYYTLTVNKGKGIAGVTGAGSKAYGENITVGYTLANGYQFDKWTGDKTTAAFTMPANDVTMTAVGKVIPYTITYDLNEGALPEGKSNPDGFNVESSDITLEEPVRRGYTFLGWTGYNGDTPEKNLTILTGSTESRSYTANWQINVYKITFDANGGTVSENEREVTFNDPYGDLPIPEYGSYSFDGWYTTRTGRKQVTVSTLMDAEDVTLYAHWYNTTYKVVHEIEDLNGNYIEKDVDNLKGIAGTQVTPELNEYEGFTAPSATEVTILPDNATTVTYKYSRNSYTVTVQKGIGIDTVSGGGIYKYGAEVNLGYTEETGYSFTGWTGDINEGSFNMPARNLTVIANGHINDYTVTLDNRDATVPGMSSVTVTYNTTLPSISVPSKTGYRFNGYWTGINGSGLEYYNSSGIGTVWDIPSDRTLYAFWEVNTDTIYKVYHEIELLDGTYKLEDVDECHGPSNDIVYPDRRSYQGFITPEAQELLIRPDGQSELTYKYIRKTYNVTVNKGAGIDAVTGDGPYKYQETVNLGYTLLDGYEFNKWSGDMNEASFSMPACNLTIQANGKLHSYDINYVLNGGAVSENNPSKYYVNSSDIILNNPTKEGYTFKGWSGTGLTGDSNQNVIIPSGSKGDKLYIANFIANSGIPYTIYHKQEQLNGTWKTVDTENRTGTADERVIIPVNSYTGFVSPAVTEYQVKPDGTGEYSYLYYRKVSHVTVNKGTGISTTGGAGDYKYGEKVVVDYTLSDGYEFDNWTGDKTDPVFTMPAENVVMKANGKLKTYTVQYNANGGTGIINPQIKTHGETLKLKDNTFTAPTEKHFVRWSSEPDGVSTGYEEGGNYTGNENVTMYAIWSYNTYMVTLNVNGGRKTSGGKDTVNAIYDANMPDMGSIPEREGYVFEGYFDTSATTGGTKYYTSTGKPARKMDKKANMPLYARWSNAEYEVILDRQNGTDKTYFTVSYDKALPDIEVPVREGYTFLGCFDAVSNGKQYYNILGKGMLNWDKARNATLYGRWSPHSYTVRFDPGEGSGTMADVSMTYGTSKSLPESTFAYTAHTFAGWSLTPDGDIKYIDKEYVKNLTPDENGTVTLYAKWKDGSKCVVKLDDGEADTPGAGVLLVDKNTSTMDAITVPTRTGYSFLGYYLDDTQYFNNNGIIQRSINSDLKLTAKWKKNTYTAYYDAQDGVSTWISESVLYGNKLSSAENHKPTKDGYDFGGYYSEPYGRGALYIDKNGVPVKSWNMAGNGTLYAYWNTGTYTISYDYNCPNNAVNMGGVVEDQIKEFGIPLTVRNNTFTPPKQTGYSYVFKYWSTQSGDLGHTYTEGSQITEDDMGHIEDDVFMLYAHWEKEASKSVVTLNKNKADATAGTTSVNAVYASSLPDIEIPALHGFAFIGYFDGTDEDSVQYYDANGKSVRNWDKSENTTLYAHWGNLQYTIEYNYNCPSEAVNKGGNTESQIKIYNTPLNLNSNNFVPPFRTGYEYIPAGWATSPDGVKVYEDKGAVLNTDLSETNGAVVNLYALWERKEKPYVAVLDVTSGVKASGGKDSVTPVLNKPMPDMGAKPLKTGYTFTGFFDVSENGIQYYKADGTSARSWDKEDSEILYAQYSPNHYFLKFNGNTSTSGSMSNEEFIYDTEKAITSNVFAKTGYSFVEWNTAANGSGTDYANGIKVINLSAIHNAVINLYAQWKANDYTVTLDMQGGTGGDSSTTATYDSAMRSINVPSRTGYTFGGYYTETNGGGTKYYNANGTSAKTWNIASHKTLYAKWTENTYSIVFNGNGNTGGSTTGHSGVKYTQNVTLNANGFTKTGYEFVGWNSLANNSGTSFTDKKTVSKLVSTAGGTYNMYAQWNPISYTIAYDRNTPSGATGGGGSTANQTKTYNTALTLKTNGFSVPTKTGYTYTFKNWTTAASGGTAYNGGATLNTDLSTIKNDTVTLYAQWNRTVNNYTVTLNLNGGTKASGGKDSVIATFDAAMPAMGTKPTRTGYTFNGFYDATSGGTQYYKADGSSARAWNKGANTTLYAQWTANTYTVTLNVNGGSKASDGKASVIATFGSNMPGMGGKPTRTGYNFAGYYDATSGGTQYYTAAGGSARTWNKASATTLYARWTPNTYSVAFNANGGSGSMSNESFTYDTAKALTANAFTRSGYTFNGWNTKSDGKGTTYANKASVKNLATSGTVTLYAQWNPIYNLTWNSPLSNLGSYVNTVFNTGTKYPSYVGSKQIYYTKPDGTKALANPYTSGTISVRGGTTVYLYCVAENLHMERNGDEVRYAGAFHINKNSDGSCYNYSGWGTDAYPMVCQINMTQNYHLKLCDRGVADMSYPIDVDSNKSDRNVHWTLLIY